MESNPQYCTHKVYMQKYRFCINKKLLSPGLVVQFPLEHFNSDFFVSSLAIRAKDLICIKDKIKQEKSNLSSFQSRQHKQPGKSANSEDKRHVC